MRGAELDGKRAAHFIVRGKCLLKFLARERAARGDDGETVCARILICLCMRNDLLLREKAVGIDTCLVACCLRAIFAVLPAAPAAPVDNRTQVDVVAAEVLLQTVRPLAQLLDRRIHKDGAVVCTADTIPRDDLLRQFVDTIYAHKKIPALS